MVGVVFDYSGVRDHLLDLGQRYVFLNHFLMGVKGYAYGVSRGLAAETRNDCRGVAVSLA
jgi:hypothetical protein